MSISLSPFDFHCGSYVIPNELLNGTTNPNKNARGVSTVFFKEGMALLKEKPAKAKKIFLSMFGCRELKPEDFATVGKALTEPRHGSDTLQLDMFAKKFLKQAAELGSDDPVVYDRLAQLYINKLDFVKAEDATLKFQSLGGNTEKLVSLFTQIYSAKTHPGSYNSVKFGLYLAQNTDTRDLGDDILIRNILGCRPSLMSIRALKSPSSPRMLRTGFREATPENQRKMVRYLIARRSFLKDQVLSGEKIGHHRYHLAQDMLSALAVVAEYSNNKRVSQLCQSYFQSQGLNAQNVISHNINTRVLGPIIF